MRVYTIGHSTRSMREFLDIARGLQLIVDIRKFPTSKKFPHFNKESLESSLSSEGIHYLHYPELGGYRSGGYVAFTHTSEFKVALERLLNLIGEQKAALMCAEAYYGRCHRRFVSDELLERGVEVVHIHDLQRTEDHSFIPRDQLKVFCDKKAEEVKF